MSDLIKKLHDKSTVISWPERYEIADEIERLESDIGYMGTECIDLRNRIAELGGALQDMFALIDDGFLCRDISRDAEPGWSIKMLGFVQRLAKNKQALKD